MVPRAMSNVQEVNRIASDCEEYAVTPRFLPVDKLPDFFPKECILRRQGASFWERSQPADRYLESVKPAYCRFKVSFRKPKKCLFHFRGGGGLDNDAKLGHADAILCFLRIWAKTSLAGLPSPRVTESKPC